MSPKIAGTGAGPAPPGDGVVRTLASLASGEVAARLLGFAATVYLARTLGAGPFGVVGFALAVRLYLVAAVEAGIDSTGVREVARDRASLAEVVPALLHARLVVAVGLAVLTAAAALALLPAPDGPVLAAYALTLVPIAANPRWVAIGLGRARAAAAARVAGELVLLALALLLVRIPADVGKVPLAQVAGDVAAAAFVAVALARAGSALRVGRSWRPAAGVLRQSLPLAGHALLGLVMFNADLLFLRAFRDRVEVGQYAAAYTLVSFFVNLGVTYYHSLLPAMSRLEGQAARLQAVYGLALARALAAGLPVAVGGAAIASGVLRLFFGEGYVRAAVPLAVLLASIPVSLFRNVAQAGLVAGGRPDALLRTSLVAAPVNLALNLLLIPPYGMLGAAAATLVTEGLRTVLAIRFAQGIGLALPHARRFVAPLVASAAMLTALVMGNFQSVFVAIPVGMVAYAVVLAVTPGGLASLRGTDTAS